MAGSLDSRAVPAVGQILVQPDDLSHRVQELAEEISRDYEGRELLLVGVLKGAVFFLSDLMRQLASPARWISWPCPPTGRPPRARAWSGS